LEKRQGNECLCKVIAVQGLNMLKGLFEMMVRQERFPMDTIQWYTLPTLRETVRDVILS
jgi:hypothetical protein